LPERLAARVPPLFVELGIGLLTATLALAIRASLTPLVGDVAPYSLVFVAVTVASVLAGWRSGLVALVAGQVLTWFAIVAPVGSFELDPQRYAALVIASLAQVVLLSTIALYQREVDRGAAEREQRLSLLDQALKEIDHRTRNNYQTVLAMISLQARRASVPQVSDALLQVADRIQAIANASQQLAVKSEELAAVRLDDHLTNAIKHAFAGRDTGRVLISGRSGSAFELTVSDDGQGIEASRRDGHSGLGSKLVESFAKQLGAKHQVSSSEQGTTHRLLIPSLE
jgi:two-component sensor histidine kinase